jgi:hypothetical protein
VMGQEEVARLITPDSNSTIPLLDAISGDLSFKLGFEASETERVAAYPSSSACLNTFTRW